jgi:hypothetical protein
MLRRRKMIHFAEELAKEIKRDGLEEEYGYPPDIKEDELAKKMASIGVIAWRNIRTIIMSDWMNEVRIQGCMRLYVNKKAFIIKHYDKLKH